MIDFFLQFKAVLEFEPGLYTHHQVIGIFAIARNTPKMVKLIYLKMKAIRDEYLKLKGIKFGWIVGKKAVKVSTIILNFDSKFLRRVPMRYMK